MQKLVVALFISFMIFGVVLHAPLVISDEGSNSGSNNETSGNSGDVEDANLISAQDDEDNETEDDEDELEDENETEDEAEDSGFGEGANDCEIRVEREIKFEDGKRIEEVKRKIECEDGTKEEIKIKIENRTVDGEIRERIRYEIEGEEMEIEAEDGIDLEEESNITHYKLKARLRNGNVTDIKIMPDQASEIALERLRALNFTIQLREVPGNQNVPHVVYNIETDKHGRFLGVFKLAMKVEGEVDPVTGEFLGISKPWWAFLVSGEDSDQTQLGDDGIGEEETNETETVLANSTDANTTNNPAA